ncbi:ABC transporter ATP-binding protein [Arachidicoccus soli]|uniref:ABC transporter ATP-binding protein n=1 Tax=Arachidicoccus soli TaxID=2341117 RepID=A0A386HMF4_9BACT|nr:ABC transporter ATP-binding protein [Arachidicoccus soli]AYD46534.1 ABC transporter ATP-binding protein [Arachidicoccus soli]
MEPIISIRELIKSFGTKEVLKNINLDVFPGQVLGYIGPNGAGKSTTVKILCGLINDFEGTVTIKNMDMKEDPINAKKIIGYVPESAELYDVLTPMEFLSFMGNLYEMDETICNNRIIKLLTAFGLEDNINQRMESFSKGMRQKVLIASGILHNPDIIILDEPLSGLDANSVIVIKDLISRLAKEGKTIFYCSHMMDIVEKVSDRIILINNGNIIADGSIGELRAQQGEQSLEQIFSHLTNINTDGASNDLMNAFN